MKGVERQLSYKILSTYNFNRYNYSIFEKNYDAFMQTHQDHRNPENLKKDANKLIKSLKSEENITENDIQEAIDIANRSRNVEHVSKQLDYFDGKRYNEKKIRADSSQLLQKMQQYLKWIPDI